MTATLAGDGRWRCDGCGNLFTNQGLAWNHCPTEQSSAVQQAADVVGGVVEAMSQMEQIAGAAVQVIADSGAVHAEQDARWAALKADVDSLNVRLAETIERLDALAPTPEPEPEPEPETPAEGDG